MAETPYTYALSTDFPGGAINTDKLVAEIAASAIVTALERIDTAGDAVDVVFKGTLSTGDRTILDNDVATGNLMGGLIGAHDNAPNVEPATDVSLVNVAQDSLGHLAVAVGMGSDNGFRKVSHNFCDPCSWWHHCSEHVAQPTTSGDQLTYAITDHLNLIDVRHKRLYEEHLIDNTTVAPTGTTMTNILPTVLVDAAPLDTANEDATTGDDRYTIDYETGEVVFAVARDGGEVITATFRKATSSKYCFKPSANKKLVLTDAEIDCSEDVDMVTGFETHVYGSHTTLTAGNKALVSRRVYNSMHDFHAAARRFWGPLPSGFGGSGGVASPKWTFEWQYSRSDSFYDTANYRDLNIDAALVTLNYVESLLAGDTPFGGSVMTITFYGYEVAESAAS
jgi:hypothetical protein